MAIDIIARGMIENSNGDIGQLSEKVNSHTENSDIHVTTTDKSKWNNYETEIEQNKTDILNNENKITELQNENSLNEKIKFLNNHWDGLRIVLIVSITLHSSPSVAS